MSAIVGKWLSTAGIALAAVLSASSFVHAQDKFPSKPVKIILGFPPGGGVDVFMRDFAQKLGPMWGQAVVVENRPGAGSVVGMDAVAKAAPDGYTLLGGTTTVVVNMLLGKVNYDIRKIFAPVIRLSSQAYILVVNNSLPANSVKELIALAKAKPGSIAYASSGAGTASHMGMELLKYMSGTDMLHVPYKGMAQATTDLLGGQIQLILSTSITATPLIKAGKVKALGTTGLQRSRNFPDLPTLSEAGIPGYSTGNDYSLYAPAGTPAQIVDAINKAGSQVMENPDIRKRLEAEGSEAAAPNTPADFRKSLDQDIALLDKFIKASGYKGE